ncbi:amyotrophic lateral sclerosis 2 isoform X2 [Rhodnius prolixus]|uniref:amyotrophic lateral sclerosis 2 isoform X2 n=1 Tax=Rhodnius prolixus TaxID=13249 RepID=UPI003D18A52A
MTLVHFWLGSSKLLISDDSDVLPCEFTKIIYLNEKIFLIDKLHCLWKGLISDTQIKLKRTNINARDITVCSSILYYINDLGHVYQVNADLQNPKEIVLHEESTSCSHGYTTSSHKVTVKYLVGSSSGLIYVSDSGELWASGNHPQLGIESGEVPRKVIFFEGRHVTAADAGDDFHVIVSHKRDDVCAPSTAVNGDMEVFLSNCPQCTAEQVMSPLSPYSDNCPLGIPHKKSSESLSASTSTSKNNIGDKKSNDNTSSCTEEDSFHPSNETEPSTAVITDEVEVKDARGTGSMLLINTEAARQFLTRQLSWVSTGGEELLAEVSVPTRIIRRNVSTVASLVYERVKTVGDKVATLSRHVSGGSENNSESFEEFEELNKSNASLNSSFRWDWSYSEGSEEVMAERNGSCVSRGSRLIRGEVWTWGNSQNGQLGLGDIVRRHKPVLVGTVSHIGVIGVWCGTGHCLIHTLDGRVYGWGSNTDGQVFPNDDIKIQSSPVLCGRAILVAAGSKHSVLLTRNGTFEWFSKRISNFLEGNKESLKCENGNAVSLVCSGPVTCLVTRDCVQDVTIHSDLSHEQCFLEELLTVHNAIVKPLSRKSSLDDTISNLCSRYTDVLHVTAVVVTGLLEGRPSYEVLGESRDELVFVYENYLNTMCDVIAIAGFTQITRTVDTPVKLTACFSDRLPTRKTSSESIITCAFSQPLSHIAVYKGMVSRGGGEDEIIRWEKLLELRDTKRKEAEFTKSFWESAGRMTDFLRTPQRRIIKESRSSPLSLYNASRFSSHWFILLSDSFVHISGGSVQIHSLDTIWVDTNFESDSIQNGMNVITPEETMTLIAANYAEKSDWFQAFQSSIKMLLNKQNVPAARTASYLFLKHSLYTNATYTGRWLNGKMEGAGKLEWPDGRVYTGQFRNNTCHGYGIIETPSVSVYEGQWREGFKNGHGVTKYDNGDIYIGYYKDGLECGHGVRKIGRFTSSQASVYVGEWLSGQKHGYGVMNNISSGEKYLGLWSNNMKNGSGLSVTLDGIYYEGQFVQDILTGHGVMVFEDGTYYEGELREAGVFSGKGTLTFSSGDTFEGSLHGTWADGVKISGTLHKHLPTSSPRRSFSKPSSFGQLCVLADQKWKSIFKQCWASLGGNNDTKLVGNEATQRAWENVASALCTSRHASRVHELLHTIPHSGRHNLDLQQYKQIVLYLQQAFETTAHPLGRALAELVEAYTTTYGGVLVHPLLLPQAVAELQSITQRLYQVVTLLFPALPETRIEFGTHEEASMTSLLHPIILPKIYSSLLVLYSLHNKGDNDTYWKRLLKWNRQPDSTLMPFLGVDKKFWMSEDGSQIKEGLFNNAIISLQQLKTTFSPMEKLFVIHSTFQEITKAVQKELGEDFIWEMDDLFPVFHYVVVRSHIQELGSEIHFIEDFIDPRLKHGEMDIMFTTLKACFFQILQEKINITN